MTIMREQPVSWNTEDEGKPNGGARGISPASAGGTGTRSRRSSTAAVAVAAVCTLLLLLLLSLLVSNVQGPCHHSHSHRLSLNVPSDLAAGAASAGFQGQMSDDEPSDIELLRRVSNVGMARRQSASVTTPSTTTTATSASASASGTVLVDFQVHQPVLTPDGATLDTGVSNGEAGEVEDSCQVVVMDHVFAYSYGEPYIGECGVLNQSL